MNLARTTASAFLAYFCVSGVLSTIGLVSGPMAEFYAVPVTEITSGFSWLTIGMLIGAGLAIDVVDRFPIRFVLLVTFGVIGACLCSLLINRTLNIVWPALGLVGICLGIGLAAAATTIARSYEPQPRASMLVITDACFSLAGKLCVAFTLYMLARNAHWSAGYLTVVGAAAAIVLFAAFSKYPDPVTEETQVSDRTRWPPDLWFCIFVLCLYTLGQYAMLWWLPQHLQTAYGADAESAGAVVGQFWVGMFWAQLLVAWWVLKIGAPRLVLISAVSAALCSVPLWSVADVELMPWLGVLWGFGNLAFLKLAISYATQLQAVPSPRLVSALLFGATSGTAMSPWLTSRIVESFGTQVVLQFSTGCYLLIALIMALLVWRNRELLKAQ